MNCEGEMIQPVIQIKCCLVQVYNTNYLLLHMLHA